MEKRNLSKLLWLLPLILLLSTPALLAQEQEPVEIYYFYGQGCHYCAEMSPFLDKLSEEYNIDVNKYEIYFNKDNREFFEEMSSAHGYEIEGVPAIFIDGNRIVGYSPQIAGRLESKIQQCLEEPCEKPSEKLNGGPGDFKQKLTIGAVLSAAAVDAINPCAFAVLIILLSTVLLTGNKKHALMAGLAFSASIYISYFLMGLGLYTALNAAGATRIIYTIAASLAILFGLFNLKDYLWYGKWFVIEVPMKWRPAMQSLIRGVTSVPGAFFIGFVISLFLLPCTSGQYIVILDLLTETVTRNSAILWLLLYNFIFILPMLIITALVSFGLSTPERLNEIRAKRIKTLHLIAGVILLLLGIGMFISMAFGII